MTTSLAELKRLAEAATPGQWFWRFNTKSKSCHLSASGKGMGWRTVIDFCRFGMSRAAPRFCHDGIMFRPDELPGAAPPDHNGDMVIGHPDAAFIAAANPAVVIDLIARVERAESAAEGYRRTASSISQHQQLCYSMYEAAKAAGLAHGFVGGNGGIPSFSWVVAQCVEAIQKLKDKP